MKLAFFDDYKLGVVVGDKIVDVSAVTKGIKALGPQDVIRGVTDNFGALKGKLAAAAKKGKGKEKKRRKKRRTSTNGGNKTQTRLSLAMVLRNGRPLNTMALFSLPHTSRYLDPSR